MLDITRVVCANGKPEIRLCHLHAEQFVTGKPIYAETYEDRERILRELAA